MTTNIERILDASEPAAWERYSANLAITYRHEYASMGKQVRAAFKAGFDAGIGFVKTVTDDEEQT